MKENCLDIGSIQAFLDRELSQDQMARVSGHIAACDNCALMLAEAEDETAFVFPTLEREFDTLVPTQRLWSKINDSLELERENRSVWHKAWAFLALAVANPSMAAAASILVVAGLITVFWMNNPPAVTDLAVTNRVSLHQPSQQTSSPPVANVATSVPEPELTTPEPSKPERASYRSEPRPTWSERTVVRKSTGATVVTAAYLPGEESYVRTIGSLNNTVDGQKDAILRPSERISYERDMAVVNDTISKMKAEVKKNPKNELAKQVLYSSYQNKIDMLTSVAQKEELVASLQR